VLVRRHPFECLSGFLEAVDSSIGIVGTPSLIAEQVARVAPAMTRDLWVAGRT
jgi:hypothetical protein